MMVSMTRALIVIRLSNLTDETTSPERQLGVCERYCSDRDWAVVGVAEDLDVSASTTSPFERPSLKKWLDRADEYDVIVFWRVDRLVRRVLHLARMIEWSEDHDVNLVSATEAHFDLSTSFGQALAIFIGIFAQMEADAISERTTNTFAHNIREGKYRGGYPPFGYRPEKIDGEWRYVQDPVTADLARSIIARVLDGELPTTICQDLNQRKIPTPQDHFRAQQGKPMAGALWRTSNLVRALQSPTLLGQVVVSSSEKKSGKKTYTNPEVLRGDDGAPVVRSEPLIDRTTFDRVQQVLADRAGQRTPYKKSQALLLRVLHCGVCGGRMYLNKSRARVYYRCVSASVGVACGNRAVESEYAESVVAEQLMNDFGDVPMRRKVYDPGEDHAKELAEIEAELADVAGLIGTGPFKSGPARVKLETRAEALETRRQRLAEVPYRPAGYRFESTGKTFRDHWESLDAQGKNLFLRDHAVRAEARQTEESGSSLDLTFGDLPELVRAVNPDAAARLEAGMSYREFQEAVQQA